jgi:hypothetical protein
VYIARYHGKYKTFYQYRHKYPYTLVYYEEPELCMGILDKSGEVQGNMNVQKFIETSVAGIRRVGKGI